MSIQELVERSMEIANRGEIDINANSVESLRDTLKDLSTLDKVKLSTKSISSIHKLWIRMVNAYFRCSVEGVVENNLAFFVYRGLKSEIDKAKNAYDYAEKEIMQMVKMQTDGSRANSVAIKKSLWSEFYSDFMDKAIEGFIAESKKSDAESEKSLEQSTEDVDDFV